MIKRDTGVNRKEFDLIAQCIKKGESVLDVGCSDGALLVRLRDVGAVDCTGVELSLEGVEKCLSAGLNVLHGDAEEEIIHYGDESYDWVVLSFALQVMSEPLEMLRELVRVGKRAVVIFPNFGYWLVIKSLLVHGVMPVTDEMPNYWYNSQSIHFCTVKDFLHLCQQENITVQEMTLLDGKNDIVFHQQGSGSCQHVGWWQQIKAARGMFIIHKNLADNQ